MNTELTIRETLAPKTFGEMMRFSEMLAGSTFVPKDFVGKPQNVLVAIQWGMEIGLAPMQALQNIAVINGRPSLWGDAALAVVQNHPAYEWHTETTEGTGDAMVGVFTIKRKGSEPHVARFTVSDAKNAHLWSKAGPWTQYPQRMLVLRARGFALRDKFADAMKGLITAEEARDYPTQNPPLLTSDMNGNMMPVKPAPAKVVPAKEVLTEQLTGSLEALKPRPVETWTGTQESVFIDTISYHQTKPSAKSKGGNPYAIIHDNKGESFYVWDTTFFAAAEANKGRTLTLKTEQKGKFKTITGGLEPIEDVPTEDMDDGLAPLWDESDDKIPF